MKLIYCTECQDVVRLKKELKTCDCGASGGIYRDEINAEIWGPCVPIGFANKSFLAALRARPEIGQGAQFSAFVMPRVVKTIKEIENDVCA